MQFVLTVLAVLACASPAVAITLDAAYTAAVARSETLARQTEGLAEADAKIAELRAAALPRLGVFATQRWQDKTAGDAVTSRFNQSSQTTAWLGLHQPLFSGFREFLVLKAGRALKAARAEDLRLAEALLRLDVARAFLDLLETRHASVIRQDVRDLTSRRVDDLDERSRLGRSRAGEVLAARVQLAQLDADLELQTGADAAALERLRFLTGLAGALETAPVGMPVLPALDGLLALSRTRADVVAHRHELAAAELALVAARRERWPVLSADGSWYLRRPGIQEDVRWDAVVAAEFPLFSGGAVSARIRAADAARRAASIAAGLTERLAASDVRTAHQTLDSTLRAAVALERAADLAQRNIDAQNSDYRNGLVTNLEVLGALDGLLETRLRLDQTRLNAALAAVALDVAAGRLPGTPPPEAGRGAAR